MEPEDLLPCPQEPANGLHSEPIESSPYTRKLFKINLFLGGGEINGTAHKLLVYADDVNILCEYTNFIKNTQALSEACREVD
jgi:hypothetical protein